MAMIADRALTDLLASDVDAAFPDVVRLVGSDVYAGALRMLGNRHDAEDVTQEALVRAYRALVTYPPARIRELRLRAWVWTIAANLCRNHIRQRARRPAAALHDTDPLDPSDGPDVQAVHAETAGELAGALLTLPWPMRRAVVLRHVVGLTSEEIADAVGRPAATVRSDIHRGLTRLRALYPEEAP
jgi:RNA polymerase sigma factor (sigma-70 family)